MQNKVKTPDQVMQESYEYTKKHIEAEKKVEAKNMKERVSALRAIFNVFSPNIGRKNRK